MVMTSHEKLGETGDKTGLEDFVVSYYMFSDAARAVGLASPRGGQPPIGRRSTEPDARFHASRRFDDDEDLRRKLGATQTLSTVIAALCHAPKKTQADVA